MPVLPASETRYYFGDALNYSAFSIPYVPLAAFASLPTLLARMGNERLQKLQSGLLAYRRLLLWKSPTSMHPSRGGGEGGVASGGLAYEMVLRELCRRATYALDANRSERHHVLRQTCEGMLPMELRSVLLN